MDHKLQKVDPRSITTNRLHRSAYRLHQSNGLPTNRTLVKDPRTHQILSKYYPDNCNRMVQPSRITNILSRFNFSGSTLDQTTTTPLKSPLEKPTQHVNHDSNERHMPASTDVVAGPKQCDDGSTLDTSTPRIHHIHRQLGSWLGGDTPVTESLRNMDISIHTVSHKSKGTQSSMGDSQTLPKNSTEQECNGCHGQHNSCLLSQQIGRNKIKVIAGHDRGHSTMVQTTEHHSQSETHTRTIQCHSRSTVSQGPNPIHRVVNSPQCSTANRSHMGETPHRHVRDPIQSPTATVLLSSPGSTGSGDRRHVTILGKHSGIRIPTTSPPTENLKQNQSRKLCSLSGSTSLGVQKLVPQPVELASGLSKKTKTNQKTTAPTTKRHLSSKSSKPQSTRLEIIQKHLMEKGFSKPVAHSISQRCRTATNKLYEARWRIYVSWCRKQQINPLHINEQQLGDFFHYLAVDQNKGLSALQGYRAVINSTIQLCTRKDLCNNFYLNSQLRSYKAQIIKQQNQVPKWNLTLVLNSLIKPPYEPLLDAPLKFITWKTAFLTAFATAARVSELRALAHDQVAHDESWSKVTLQTHELFIAKNQDLAIDCSPRKFDIPALFDYAGPDLPDRLLCPVRSLRHYLFKSEPLRTPQKKALFISYDKRKTTDITTNTLSNWIKNVIKHAYSNAKEDDRSLAKASAHEVRALAASAAFQTNLSMKSINQACYWRGHNTFSSYYLRDIALHKNGELILPHVVAASKKITQ